MTIKVAGSSTEVKVASCHHCGHACKTYREGTCAVSGFTKEPNEQPHMCFLCLHVNTHEMTFNSKVLWGNPWWDVLHQACFFYVLQAFISTVLGLCDAVFTASDLISVSLLATELGAGVTGPLRDAYWDCVWRTGTSPEVKGEEGLPLWWCAHLCQYKCQVSPSCRAEQSHMAFHSRILS